MGESLRTLRASSAPFFREGEMISGNGKTRQPIILITLTFSSSPLKAAFTAAPISPAAAA
jgi:hypothetical protein